MKNYSVKIDIGDFDCDVVVQALTPAAALVPAGYANDQDIDDIGQDLKEESAGFWTLNNPCGTVAIRLVD
jgi:hypothetical protein